MLIQYFVLEHSRSKTASMTPSRVPIIGLPACAVGSVALNLGWGLPRRGRRWGSRGTDSQMNRTKERTMARQGQVFGDSTSNALSDLLVQYDALTSSPSSTPGPSATSAPSPATPASVHALAAAGWDDPVPPPASPSVALLPLASRCRRNDHVLQAGVVRGGVREPCAWKRGSWGSNGEGLCFLSQQSNGLRDAACNISDTERNDP